ncbi:DNA repair protein RAD50-like isoform X2 [Mya arenaria]|nr:DNA repair protein RAD50-like isoform X2 [Mya arenaria]
MSKIEKMSIQGIRSFDPDEDNKQIIQFQTPLTLILGPNGTGKTTIIECLKYITTGLMPPGSSKGGAFIHDPKVAGEREVRGQIRLQLRDVTHCPLIVTRSLTATQKGKKVEMKTLEAQVTRINANGEKQQTSSKCIDLDREMISSLGVSKPVLENVIFCHQEEANWPLGEGKQVKEKFDAIFASTRYVKALESIKKTKKEQDEKLKLYKNDIQYLKQNKEKAHQLEADLSEQEGKLAASHESVDRVKNQLAPIEEKMKKIDNQSAEIFNIQNNVTKWTSERKQIEKYAAELQDQIENEFQGSDSELKRVLTEFEDKLEDRQRTLQEYEGRQGELSRKVEKLDREKSAILVELGRLEQEAERQDKNVEKRDDLIKEYAQEYGFQGLHGGITDEKYKQFLKNMKEKLDTMISTTRETKEDYDGREQDLQLKIDELRSEKSKLEQNIHIKKDMLDENRRKEREINRKLSAIEASGGRLDQIKRNLRRKENDLETVEGSLNPEDLRQEMATMSDQKAALEGNISKLDSEMSRLHLETSAQAELDMLRKDQASKQEAIRRLRAKRESVIKELLGRMPEDSLREDLEDYISTRNDAVRRTTDKQNSVKNSLSTMEAKKNLYTEQVKKKEGELRGLEERVYNVCGSQNFDEGLSIITEKVDRARDQRGSLLGAEHFFKKYTADLQKESPCCPLCHRGFDSTQEVRDLVAEIKENLRKVPGKLEKATQEMEEFQEKYDQINQLKPVKENIEKVEKEELPQLKKSLKSCQDESQKLRDQLVEIEEALDIEAGDVQMAKEAQPDVVMIDRYQGELVDLEKKITIQASKLSSSGSGRTLQMVIDEKEELQIKVDGLLKQIDFKRGKLTDHQDSVQSLRGGITGLREEKLTIERDLQEQHKLEEDKANIALEDGNLQQEIKDSNEKLRPLQSKINNMTKDKEEVVREKEEKIEASKAEVEVVKGHATEVRNINHEIKSYNQSGRAGKLEESRGKKNKLEQSQQQMEEEQRDIAGNIDKLRKDLATQKLREQDLKNNLILRAKQRESREIRVKIAELEEKLGDIDVAYLDQERRKLESKLQDLTKQRHTAEGRQTELENQIRASKRELQSDMYRGAVEKYRNKMIDLRTTELANTDLEKYYKALDKAIMNYHNVKMEEINKIIRELWRNTYKGNDIETIEIRSDEDDSTTSIRTRKTYNYRVVLIKPGGVVIDMRGRCSAGQKVLASLLIRLALAETFCLNCGILALDEPTTNLDRENIESLAGALVDIIKGRRHQKNFQLVVITHDEDFVELLGRSDYVDYFFKVAKNQ